MPAPLAFVPAAIKIGVGVVKGATAAKAATATAAGAKVGIGVFPLTAAPIVPVAKVAATGTAAAKVSVVTGAIPLGLKSAAPTAGIGLGNKVGQVIAIAGLKGVAAVQVDQALKGDQKPQVQPQTRSPIGDPRLDNRTRYQPQTQTQTSGRTDPFAPIAPQFDEPTNDSRSPKLAPIAGLDTTPRGALTAPIRGATGRINLRPIDSSRQGLSTPTSLDQVDKGGVNLLTPIVNYLKKLDLDVQELKNPDFSPLLEQIMKMITPIMEQLQELPKTILSSVTDLLNPIVGLITTTLEGVIKIPELNAEAMIETVAPVLLGILILESLFENLTETIKSLNLKMQVEIPQGLAMQMEVPQGLAMQMEVPQGLAMQMEVPQGLAMQMEVPQGLAMQMEVPQGLAMQMEVPQGLAMQMEVPQGLAMQMEVPQGLALQVEVPQTLTVAADLPTPDIETKLRKLQKTAEETKKELEKCCKDIGDKLKKKKKEDDDRFPEFKNAGSIECDGATIPYSYSGPGLVGLHKQLEVILGINKMALKKICEMEPSVSFPEIFGGGTYACGSSVFSYDYSGPGLLGLSDQVTELTALNKKILTEVCDRDDTDIAGSIDFFDCDGGTQVLLYNGDGIAGLSNQITALTELQKLAYAKACETPICYPVQPGDEFAEFDVPRQLVLTWGENYPKQTGSLWHTQVPNPREDLEWCRDFDNLLYTKGNVYGRLLWGASKIKSGVRAVTEEEAERILDLIDNLSTSEGKLRITKGGAVKLDPAVRSIRCVRAAIAQLGPDGVAVTVKCFVPPIEGC
ncbi:MAG: hypothetical protein ACBR50_10120 [Microcoleus sp.]